MEFYELKIITINKCIKTKLPSYKTPLNLQYIPDLSFTLAVLLTYDLWAEAKNFASAPVSPTGTLLISLVEKFATPSRTLIFFIMPSLKITVKSFFI